MSNLPPDALGVLRDTISLEVAQIRKLLTEAQRRFTKIERSFVPPSPERQPSVVVEMSAITFLCMASINNAVAHADDFKRSFSTLLLQRPPEHSDGGTSP